MVLAAPNVFVPPDKTKLLNAVVELPPTDWLFPSKVTVLVEAVKVPLLDQLPAIFKVPAPEKIIDEVEFALVIAPFTSTDPVLIVNLLCLLLDPPPVTIRFPPTFNVPAPTAIVFVLLLEPGPFIVASPDTVNATPELILRLVFPFPPFIVIDFADLLSVTITEAPTAIYTSSLTPGITPPFQVEVLLQLPPELVDVIVGSVNSVHTFSPEDCPTAVALNNFPRQCPSLTFHTVLKLPVLSAVTFQVWCSGPVASSG